MEKKRREKKYAVYVKYNFKPEVAEKDEEQEDNNVGVGEKRQDQEEDEEDEDERKGKSLRNTLIIEK